MTELSYKMIYLGVKSMVHTMQINAETINNGESKTTKCSASNKPKSMYS